jgi:hypothetical protein
MKINPPKVIIDEKEPFKDALFGREEFAKSLTNLLRNVSDNLVVFVNAPWGAGKTTFSEMWRADLRQQKLEVIYFNSYAADYFDDPFVSFSGEILGFVDSRLSEGKGLLERREFKKTAVEVGKRLAGLAAKVGLRAATLGAIESAHIEEFKEISADVASGVSEIGADFIEKKIENYVVEKESLESFKKSLANLAAKVRTEQGFPLTIIVDELDRCRPDFALGLLERMKHLFDVEGVAFVLLVNRDQIESYIRAVYGEHVDARAYLLKFGSLFIDLPSRSNTDSFVYVKGNREYCFKLLQHHDFSKNLHDGRYLVTCIDIFAGHFNLTLREIEKVFSILTIYYSSVSGNYFTTELLVALLSVLKVKQPTIYQAMVNGILPMDEFYQQTGLDLKKFVNAENFSPEWAKDMLDYCIMSESEFEKATKSAEGTRPARPGIAQMEGRIRMARNKIIPYLCSQLDRFSPQLG